MSTDVVAAIRACTSLPEAERVAIYNAAQEALGRLVSDVTTDPACSPRLVESGQVVANDYNPNHVATPEMDLLERSIQADGITMTIVVVRDPESGGCVVVDGFHRHCIATRLGRKYVPCAIINRSLAERMESTVRHNRARGKHEIELMAALVKGLMDLGQDDDEIAEALGMSVEELLRLRQIAGAARMLAATEYSRSWGNIE